jgi:hypothetical protein
MSKARRIEDHGNWIGAGSGNLPTGVKMKEYSSAEGAGGLSNYEETSEDIKGVQEMGIKKVKAHSSKPGYRN